MLIDTYHFNPHRRESQNTLLHVATWNGALDTVKMLIERYGLNPHTEGQQGGRPLHMAVSSGNAELVKYLVDEYHLNPHTTDGHGYTILHEVGSNNHNLRQMIINDYRVTTEKKEQDSCCLQ